jgi:hypothetical protein
VVVDGESGGLPVIPVKHSRTCRMWLELDESIASKASCIVHVLLRKLPPLPLHFSSLVVLFWVLCSFISIMAPVLPFRDINVHASPTHYAFSSPSTPTAPTLVIDRPTGDISLTEEKRLGSQRISSIAGILGIITLRLGMSYCTALNNEWKLSRCKINTS